MTHAAAANVQVVPLGRHNYEAFAVLQVAADQARFVADNWESLAEALLYAPAAQSYGILADGVPAGFMTLFDRRIDPDEADRTDELFIWRVMVVAERQRQGIGGQVLDWVEGHARGLGLRRVSLSHHPENAAASALYARRGFSHTGQERDGELLMTKLFD